MPGPQGIPDAQIDPLRDGQLEDPAWEWRDVCPVHGDGLGAERTGPDEEVGAAGGIDDPQTYRPAGQGANHVRIGQGTAIGQEGVVRHVAQIGTGHRHA